MTRPLPVGRVGRRIEGLLLDVDGVLTVSWEPLPGAVEALERIRTAWIPFRLVTNTTELTRRELVDTLARAGFTVGPEDLVTAVVATGELLESDHPGARCLVIGGPASREDLGAISIVGDDDPAEVVVVGGSSEAVPWDVANRALRLVLAGAPLVAMHGSLTWMTEGGMVLDTGRALVLALEEASGRRATVAGKPSGRFFEQALRLLGAPPAGAAMVGDDVVNDVLAAQGVGMTGVLVRTGKFDRGDLRPCRGEPDHVIDSVAALPELLGLD
jgi:HAD superfamily hydrolase (TIGR01458 family)